jgi:transcriptional regulator with XRE-family HTH domain
VPLVDNLRLLRTHQNFSQPELARRTRGRGRVSQRRISDLERGIPPRPEEVCELARALNVDPAALGGPPLLNLEGVKAPDVSSNDQAAR